MTLPIRAVGNLRFTLTTCRTGGAYPGDQNSKANPSLALIANTFHDMSLEPAEDASYRVYPFFD